MNRDLTMGYLAAAALIFGSMAPPYPDPSWDDKDEKQVKKTTLKSLKRRGKQKAQRKARKNNR